MHEPHTLESLTARGTKDPPAGVGVSVLLPLLREVSHEPPAEPPWTKLGNLLEDQVLQLHETPPQGGVRLLADHGTPTLGTGESRRVFGE